MRLQGLSVFIAFIILSIVSCKPKVDDRIEKKTGDSKVDESLEREFIKEFVTTIDSIDFFEYSRNHFFEIHGEPITSFEGNSYAEYTSLFILSIGEMEFANNPMILTHNEYRIEQDLLLAFKLKQGIKLKTDNGLTLGIGEDFSPIIQHIDPRSIERSNESSVVFDSFLLHANSQISLPATLTIKAKTNRISVIEVRLKP